MFQTDVDLLHQHFPLVPLDDPSEANFNGESLYYPDDEEDIEKGGTNIISSMETKNILNFVISDFCCDCMKSW